MTLERRSPLLDWVRIHQLELNCIVGIRPRERLTEQPVVIDIELGVEARLAARSGRIAHTVDYAQVELYVSSMLRFRQYQLIESAAEELCAMLIGIHTQLREIRIRIEKPRALAGKARAASVEVQRTREDFPLEAIFVAQASGPLKGEALWRSPDAELSLVRLPPSALWHAGHSKRRRSINWLVEGELTRSGQTLEAGVVDPSSCEGDLPWANKGSAEALLFRCLAEEAYS